MTEVESQEFPFDETPPTVEVSRPNIEAPKVDSMGRSMEKKRGRPPGSKNKTADGSAPAQKTLATELKKRLPQDVKSMSDEMVGEAISSAFAVMGLFAGPHWRLLPSEKKDLGETFGPLARLYGPEELAKWVTILMCVPVVTTVLAPRIAIQSMIAKKQMDKNDGRASLLQIKGMMAAEATLDIELQAQENAEFLRSNVAAGMRAAATMKVDQMKEEGMVNGT